MPKVFFFFFLPSLVQLRVLLPKTYFDLSFFLITGAVVGHGQSAGAPPIYEIQFQKGLFVRKGIVHPVYPYCRRTAQPKSGNGGWTSLSLKATKGMPIPRV